VGWGRSVGSDLADTAVVESARLSGSGEPDDRGEGLAQASIHQDRVALSASRPVSATPQICEPRRYGRRVFLASVAGGLSSLYFGRVAWANVAPAVSTTTWKSGCFASGPSGVTAFGNWRGTACTVAHAYAAGATWADIQLDSSWLAEWKNAGYASKMAISIPMLPKNDTTTTLAHGAAGTYNSYWKTAAARLVAAGMANATLRIGWEFNGGWFRWAAKSNPSGFAAYFRQIVQAMRSAPGQAFRFVWCPSAAYAGWDATTAYPGNAYVDIVGLDGYDTWYNHPNATPAQRWTQIVAPPNNVKGGLTFWAGFAQSHSRPMAFCEWGLVNKYAKMAGPDGGGGGDDPYYIQQMHNWLAAHNVVYDTYTEVNASDGGHLLEGASFPKAATLYKSLWG
jgi:hypothetical protein